MVSEKRYGKNVPAYHKVTWAQITYRRWKKMPVAITFFLSVYVTSPSQALHVVQELLLVLPKHFPSLPSQ